VKITDREPIVVDDGLIPAERFYCEAPHCEGHDRPFVLVMRLPKGCVCWKCYRRLRQPSPGPCTAHEAEMARQAAVDKMQKRGGAHAHLVRKGLT
jgi:hypothetical protein